MPKESGKKGKEEKKRPPRTFFPRRTMTRTVKRLEVRRKTHERHVARKQAKLKKRCEVLSGLLKKDMPEGAKFFGRLHRNLRRLARVHRLIGLPIKPRKPKKEVQYDDADDE